MSPHVWQVLAGRNKTRVAYNDRLRELKNMPHHEPVPGTCVAVTLEGRRPLLAEVDEEIAVEDRQVAEIGVFAFLYLATFALLALMKV